MVLRKKFVRLNGTQIKRTTKRNTYYVWSYDTQGRDIYLNSESFFIHVI